MPTEPLHWTGRYEAVYTHPDGTVGWRAHADNLIVTLGKNFLLDALAASALTTTTYVGLKGSGTVAATDTMASHAGWSELGGANAPAYTGNRPTVSWSAASGGAKAYASNVTFTFSAAGTIYGIFMVLNGSATKDNTTGTLFNAGDFSASQAVTNGGTLTVSYSATLT